MLEEMLSSCVESFLGQGMCILVLKRKRDLDLTNTSHDQK